MSSAFKRGGRLGVSLLAALFMLAAVAAPARATTPPATTTGNSSIAQATAGSVNPTITVSGPLAGLVGPLVSSTLGTILSAVANVPNSLVNGIVNAIVGNYSASTPSSNGSITSNAPSPCSSPSCYSAGATSVNAGIANVSVGAAQGWVQYDTSGAKPKIQSNSVIASQSLSVLTYNLLQLGQINATTSCTENGTSTADASVDTSKILGGADLGGVDIKNTAGSLSVRFKNGSFQPLSALSSPVTLGVAGVSATASAGSGGYLKVTLHLSVADLLSMLGLPPLDVAVASSTVDLTVSVGSVALVTSPSTAAQAWGLEVGLDLAADVKISLVGADAELSIPTGLSATTFGNLLDLRLGFAACTAGSPIPTPPPSWLGPELS